MEREWELQGSAWHHDGVVRNEGISLLQGWFGSKPLPAGVELRQPGPCCGLGRLLCLHPAELPLNGAWHRCSVGQRVTGGTARLSRSLALSPSSLSARIAEHRFHLQLLCLSAGVQRVLMLGKTLGVLITQGVQPLCQGYAGQCLQGVWGLWRSLSGVLGWNQGLLGAAAAPGSRGLIGIDYQRWEQ